MLNSDLYNILYSETQGCFHVANITKDDAYESNGYLYVVKEVSNTKQRVITNFISKQFPAIDSFPKRKCPKYLNVMKFYFTFKEEIDKLAEIS